MCNCNSSFCAVCCRRVKAYRFDNVPEITGDLQLYTEFYKVGEAYGHWKFTVDDLEAYLDIPTVLWQDKLVAFGHTATGGLFYDSAFIWNYTDSALTIGDRGVAAEGLYSLTIGNANTAEGLYSLIVGESNVTNTTHSAVFGKANSILGSYNSIFGQGNNINGSGNNVFGAGNIVGDNSNIFGASLDTNGFYGNAMFSDQTGGSAAIANDAFTAQFAGGYRFRLDASSTAVNISSTGIVTIDNVVNNNTETQLLVWNSTTKEVEYRDVSSLPGGGGGSGTVTSVDAAFLNGTALTVVGGAITTAGTFDFEWQGLNTDYVAGDGSIIAFPTLTSGTVTSVSAGNGMTFTTITTSGAVTLGTPSSITLASTNSVGVGTHSHSFVPGGTTAQYIRGDGTLATTPLGSVTSVGMTITVSTALQVTGSPITTSGTFAVTWTGNNTQYVAGDGSLITFPTLTSGTVTAVNSGAGMDFTNFTTSGTIILGTPSTITLASVNAATGTTHSHEFDLGGTAGQYLAGDNTLQTFPTIPVALWADKRLAFGQTAAGGLTYDSYIKYDYSTYSFTIGTRSAGTEGLYSTVIGVTNLNSDNYTFQIGDQLSNTSGAGNLNIGNNNTGTTSFFSALIGKTLTYTGSYSIIGGLSQSVNGSNNGIFGGYNSVIGSFNLVSGVNHDVTGDRNFVHGYLNTITHTGVTMLSDANYTGTTASTADNQFIGRFGNGYIFKLTASSTAVAINSSGQIVANFVPSSPSSTDIIVRGGGNILSYRTVSSLPFTNNTGTVTNFSANDLTTFTDPLFTVNVTNPTTIPDLTFTLPTLTQKLVFAAPWGVSGQPFWRQLLPSDLQADGATTGQVITWNGTQWTPQTPTGGGVTSVSAGNGMNFTTITTTGAVTMGTPSNITLASTNSATGTTHSHAFVPGGSATTQYVTGSGTLATNLWTAYGGYLMPTGGNAVRTNNTGGHGYILLEKGNASNSGNLQIYNTSARVGYIGNELSYMNYTAETGNHRFYGNNVYLDVIPSQPTGAYLLCTTTAGSGIISYRNVSALTGLTTDVFKIQGGTTNASAITDDIYHNGKLKLGTSTSSAYQLSVSGTGYFTSTVDFNNNVGIQGFTTGAVIKNLVKLNSSNQEEIGVSGTDIILPAYTSARSADTKVSTDKYMYVNASGLVKLDSDQNIRNVIGWISKTTNTGVTAGGGPTKISGSTVQQTAGGPYTTVSGNLTIPAQDRYHLITVTVQFVTTSGVAATPNITFDVYNGSGVVQDSAYIVNHDVINDTKEYSFVLQGTTAGVTSIYVRATATVAGITVQKCHMKAMDMGPV